jgi:RNA polymerase sigma factor (TIGR02999 family)
MSSAPRQAITTVLGDLRARVPGAMDRLLPLVYADLSRMAHRQLGLERAGHTLSTTALVHEAYLRLVDQTRAEWSDRSHFFAVAAHVMRRVLVDHARRHAAARRGGPHRRSLSLDMLDAARSDLVSTADRAEILIALDDALERLVALDERQARVVECRFFAGMTEQETAEALGVSSRTVTRDWLKARGWLYQELCDDIA